ncbi:tetratricopeptide repeat protein [bacterium]|nr:MAG: tetratricopeptide repeat protein [bacterium]
MRIFRIMLLLLASLLPAQAVFCAPAEYDKYSRSLYKDGMSALKAGEDAKALSLFKEAAAADPKDFLPLLGIGRANQMLFERTMRNYGEADQAFTKLTEKIIAAPAPEVPPEALQVYLFHGFLYLKGGDYERAIPALEKYLELDKETEKAAQILNGIGIANYYLGQYDLAVVYFKRALEADPAFSEARFNMRSVFTRITAYSEAQVLLRAGDPKKALGRIEKLKEIAPRYLPGRELEARVLLILGRPEEAVRVFEEILGFYPANPKTYWIRIEMGRTLMTLGKRDRARAILLDNLVRFPNQQDQQARMELVNLLGQLGN